MSVVQPFPERDESTQVYTRLAVLGVKQELSEKQNEDFKAATNRRLDNFDSTLRKIDEKLDTLHLELVELRKSKSVPPAVVKEKEGFWVSKATITSLGVIVGWILQQAATHFLK